MGRRKIGACAFAGGGCAVSSRVWRRAPLRGGVRGFVAGVEACAFAGRGVRGFVAGGGKMGLFRGIGERKRGMSKHFDRAFLLMSGVFDGQAAFLSL